MENKFLQFRTDDNVRGIMFEIPLVFSIGIAFLLIKNTANVSFFFSIYKFSFTVTFTKEN